MIARKIPDKEKEINRSATPNILSKQLADKPQFTSNTEKLPI